MGSETRQIIKRGFVNYIDDDGYEDVPIEIYGLKERGGYFLHRNRITKPLIGKCPSCNFMGGIILYGHRKLLKPPFQIKRYKCLKCNYRFSDSKYKRHRVPDFIIEKIIYGDYKTLSLRKIVKEINKEFNIKISPMTVFNLKKKFALK